MEVTGWGEDGEKRRGRTRFCTGCTQRVYAQEGEGMEMYSPTLLDNSNLTPNFS